MICNGCGGEVPSAIGEMPDAVGWHSFDHAVHDGRAFRRAERARLCSLDCTRDWLRRQLRAAGEVERDLRELEADLFPEPSPEPVAELLAPPKPTLWKP